MAVSRLYLFLIHRPKNYKRTLKIHRTNFEISRYVLLKCLRLSWVWPAALKSFCILRLKLRFHVIFSLGSPAGAKSCPKTMKIVTNVKIHEKPKFVLMVVLLLLV